MTNWDINNHEVLQMGANSRDDLQQNDWQSMDTAPRDGTLVELKCSYGTAPWYCVARWTTHNFAHSSEGLVPSEQDEPSWVIEGEGGGPADESSLFWRSYDGDAKHYVDPTGGMQDSPAYWRGAVAAKYGLPLNYFEKETARNTKNKGEE